MPMQQNQRGGSVADEDPTVTERRLVELEQRNRSLFENNPDPVFSLDAKGRFVGVNPATERITGYSRGELEGSRFTLLLDREDGRTARLVSEFERALEGEPVQVELSIVTKDGGAADLVVSVIPIEVEGEITGIFGIAKDLTERNRLAREQKALFDQLGTERARLAAVVRQMPAGVLIVEAPSGQLLLGNALADQILHRPVRRGVRIDSHFEGKIFDRDGIAVPANELPLSRALRTGETVTGEELLNERDDGTRRWIRVHASPIRDARGRIVAGVTIIDDIQEEKRSAEAMRFLAEASSVLTSSLDYRRTIRKVARLAVSRIAELCMIDLVDAEGVPRRQEVAHAVAERERSVRSWINRRSADRPLHNAMVIRVVQSGEPFLTLEAGSLVETVPENDELAGIVRALGISALLIVPLQGRHRVLGTMALAVSEPTRAFTPNDIDLAMELGRRTAAAVENAELFEAAEAASDAKSNFLAVVSHELRTPLNAIVGYSELLLMGVPDSIPKASGEQVVRIRESAEHLRRIVDEILTFTRVEGGSEELRVEPVDLRATLDESVDAVRDLATRKGLEVRLDAPRSPWTVETDGPKMGRIVGHLVSNAVKFTERGAVEVRAGVDDSRLQVVVSDTGAGIDKRHIEQIFEPFWQIDSSRTRRHEGTGLGLSVARQLARLMGGDITVSSTPGRGTEFQVVVPVGGG